MSEEKVLENLDENFSGEEQVTLDDIANKYLTFELNSDNDSSKVYGIALKDVIEIVGIQPASEVPYVPEYIKGIINLRGSIVTLVDINERFGFPETVYDERTGVIVVEIEESLVGLIVNRVFEVINVRKISPLPKEVNNISNKYISGVAKLPDEDVSVLIMDTSLVVNMNDMMGLDVEMA